MFVLITIACVLLYLVLLCIDKIKARREAKFVRWTLSVGAGLNFKPKK